MLQACGSCPRRGPAKSRQACAEVFADPGVRQVGVLSAMKNVHMNVERLLFERIGSVAGKLHTARSRK